MLFSVIPELLNSVLDSVVLLAVAPLAQALNVPVVVVLTWVDVVAPVVLVSLVTTPSVVTTVRVTVVVSSVTTLVVTADVCVRVWTVTGIEVRVLPTAHLYLVQVVGVI